ncbi:RBM34 protein, partial [Acromyrmex heyeri]
MGKVKALKHNANKGKQQLHEIKGGSVKKNKDSKFKNTSKGKVSLINNSIEMYRKLSPKISSENKSSDQKPAPNKKVSKKYCDQKSSPNKKQNFKQNKNSNKAQKIDNKTFNSKKVEKQLDKSNSNTIESEDDSSNKSDETFESDSDIPDIFGKSLGEEDDEDEDYEKDEKEADTDSDDESDEEEMDDDDGSDEEEMSERKGVKMFKGLQSKNKKNQKEDGEIESNENTTESDDDDEDNTDEDEDKDKEKQKKKDNHIKKSKNRITKNYAEVDFTESENSDSDDYSIDTTDCSDDENAELGTKALLGQSIADDDDDEDFNGEDKDSSDEDDISSEVEEDSENDDVKQEANENENSIIQKCNITQKEKDDIAKRIVLIDNIPKITPRVVIESLCREYGKYQIFEAKPYPAFFLDIEKELEQIEPLEWINRDYPHLETFSVNVLYSKKRSARSAMRHIHGLMFAGNFLNAVIADQIVQEPENAIYITNLKKTMPDNCIWDMFNRCGIIVRMRNVRDPITGLSRGFGYVSFKNADSVKRAFLCNKEKINGRRIEVMPYPYIENRFIKKLEKETRQRNQATLESGKRILENDNRSSKKFKKSSGEPANVEPERNIKKQKKQGDKKKSTEFQGQMVELKNKNKKNKLDKKKKKMAEKLAAKSKKTKKN